jgi:(p)ppGpp synthase/HD superfamily hydrolase
MLYTENIQKAIKKVSELHRNQSRRDKEQTPYVSHLFSVALLTSSFGGDEECFIAGLYHDSLEDVPGYTLANLKDEVGESIATIVETVTEKAVYGENLSVEECWFLRKKAYLKQLENGSDKARLVAACDKINNMTDMFTGYQKEGDNFMKRFISSVFVNQLWLYESVYEVVSPSLSVEAKEAYMEALAKFKSIKG